VSARPAARYHRLTEELAREAAARAHGFPWDFGAAGPEDGCVERTHMTHLLRHDAAVGAAGGRHTFAVLQFGKGEVLACRRACQQANNMQQINSRPGSRPGG
jgi:hypothetical protein